MRWWCNGSILVSKTRDMGSTPILRVMASWLSWLERRPVTAEVVGSSPIEAVF